MSADFIGPRQPVRVIIGRNNYHGQRDKFRAGWILEETLDTGLDSRGSPFAGRAGTAFIDVYCPPRERERKGTVCKAVVTELVRDTPEVRAKMLAHGYSPDAKNGCVNCDLHRSSL